MTALRPLRLVLVLVLMLVLSAPAAFAQGAPAPQRLCDMSMRNVTVRLLDRAGKPVTDAAVVVRRVQRRTLVRGTSSRNDGTYVVIEDGALPDLRPGGEPFDVSFRRDDRIRRVRLIIGMDAARCHVALKAGRTTVKL